MPIKIPDDLPAARALEAEGVVVMRETDAIRQDIRPLRFGLLNLMPNKVSTETQLARLIGASPLQIELTLIRMTDHVARNAAAEHMAAFYRPWSDVQDEYFDGFIITGAPVERLPFESVRYWPELCRVFDWARAHVHSCLTICWAAQAALYHVHRVPKRTLPCKAFGVFRQTNRAPTSPYLRGFSDEFCVPVSRWTEVPQEAIPARRNLTILADSAETGVCLLSDPDRRLLYMFNHLEYDTTTLADEYAREADGCLPENYFPENDPTKPPANGWRSHAHLLFGNWISEIYRTTPFDPAQIGTSR